MTDQPTSRSIMVDKDDFDRLEEKVDVMAKALGQLILIDERQSNQGQRIGYLEQRVAADKAESDAHHTQNKEAIVKVNSKLDRYANMAFGAWGVIGFGLTVYEVFIKH